jgi:hypothetical protein
MHKQINNQKYEKQPNQINIKTNNSPKQWLHKLLIINFGC